MGVKAVILFIKNKEKLQLKINVFFKVIYNQVRTRKLKFHTYHNFTSKIFQSFNLTKSNVLSIKPGMAINYRKSTNFGVLLYLACFEWIE